MYLHLSGRPPLNTVVTNADGQALYKVETPWSLGSKTSTVTRIIPNNIPGNEEDKQMKKDGFVYFGEVEHNPISSSVIRFGGQQFKTDTLFHKGGLKCTQARPRIFTGSDGREYRWKLKRWTSELVTNDGNKAVVAKYYPKKTGIFGKTRPSVSLEISEMGDHMVHEILMTFIYIEQYRKDKVTG